MLSDVYKIALCALKKYISDSRVNCVLGTPVKYSQTNTCSNKVFVFKLYSIECICVYCFNLLIAVL